MACYRVFVRCCILYPNRLFVIVVITDGRNSVSKKIKHVNLNGSLKLLNNKKKMILGTSFLNDHFPTLQRKTPGFS